MEITTTHIQLSTNQEIDIIDITDKVKKHVKNAGISEGQVTVFVPGSTGGLSTIEYEPGLLKDIPKLWNKLIPAGETYHHNETWHDGNGHSHLRAMMTKPDITVPVMNGEMTLGTWQQIVFLDFDVPARQRKLIVQVIGK